MTAAVLVAAGPSGAGSTGSESSGSASAGAGPSGSESSGSGRERVRRSVVTVSAPVRIADAAAVRLLRPGDRVDVVAAGSGSRRRRWAGTRGSGRQGRGGGGAGQFRAGFRGVRGVSRRSRRGGRCSRRPVRASRDGGAAGRGRCHLAAGGDPVVTISGCPGGPVRRVSKSSPSFESANWTGPPSAAVGCGTVCSTSCTSEKRPSGEREEAAESVGGLQGLLDARQCDRPCGRRRHRSRIHQHRELRREGRHQPPGRRVRHEGPERLHVVPEGHLPGRRRHRSCGARCSAPLSRS